MWSHYYERALPTPVLLLTVLSLSISRFGDSETERQKTEKRMSLNRGLSMDDYTTQRGETLALLLRD